CSREWCYSPTATRHENSYCAEFTASSGRGPSSREWTRCTPTASPPGSPVWYGCSYPLNVEHRCRNSSFPNGLHANRSRAGAEDCPSHPQPERPSTRHGPNHSGTACACCCGHHCISERAPSNTSGAHSPTADDAERQHCVRSYDSSAPASTSSTSVSRCESCDTVRYPSLAGMAHWPTNTGDASETWTPGGTVRLSPGDSTTHPATGTTRTTSRRPIPG